MLLYYDNTFKVFFVNANAFIKHAKINKSRIYYIYIFIMSKYNNTTKETTDRVHKNEYYNPILHCVYRDIEGAT